MNLMTFILTVVMVWIILFFISLPMGLKMPDKIKKGNADSAPEIHYFMPKLFITFVLSIVLSSLYWYIFYYS